MRMVLVGSSLGDMGQVLGDMALELDDMELDDKELVHMGLELPMHDQHKQALKQFSLPCLSHVNK